ncbi:DNA-(apurinic or apyrimidinic site) endonuclease 2 [Microcaecilia unicolor]|uniref:DNA-(apurinic or apyrimidinic site) endonuclease n=1 Tax=Microcaecilia unicolor TaxID=1415580 RepID=A0A6P7X2W0_9AMPH|nr:DNA-(apurinic or apyrimidinic site) lyase 2 [Microcaecilia unicolor]XP_030049906.1 DNA-(apurinic or apyrimidinic site) lyase 2 [Microcaecilia unicolor]XP_030049907.1 DNA-(apurinic or apyrimidinic site) lyase 2 [Microcaecilia unicolor]XP_030049908.1 DNA-(apurinic or apyrimidinic site) lyase 2 [Microcaecilia unicolor]XP_030049909.1 DNA-(apurinic or apyrimidinic site) lyase 2 [Microcaecilia unicolor]XP_030049910.1 DNA-(apurinic or apyrimidinic site) lyase 2 [Microcaecilia unicolor]XP_03004991
MRIVSWNINGIRATKTGLKGILESLQADVICLQETKVTRDLLDEPTAIVEGYNSYFSFSRGRSGYSGVATFCRDSVTPLAAEEGLSGLLSSHSGAIGHYGNTDEFSEEELQALDNEGRAVLTQHKILLSEGREETLTVINVYCPRADPDKPERKSFKLRFYHLLQARAEAILNAGGHVIVLGDINTSHRPIDHCDPDGLESFEENPSRKWLSQFLVDPGRTCATLAPPEERESPESSGAAEGRFLDSFRYFYPARPDAFTCWSSATGARHTNYGTRIDYILGDAALVRGHFQDSDLMPEVEGSDHCPVRACLGCVVLPAPRCPPFCTRYLPEFAGRQQKLLQFLVKVDKGRNCADKEAVKVLLESKEKRENQVSSGSRQGLTSSQKRSEAAVQKGAKRTKLGPGNGQGSLLRFLRPVEAKTTNPQPTTKTTLEKPAPCLETPPVAFWKSVLKGPSPPPLCKGHGEPCVLRTVKKAGTNHGKQFYTCARPEGHASNLQARCNFFQWATKKAGHSS